MPSYQDFCVLWKWDERERSAQSQDGCRASAWRAGNWQGCVWRTEEEVTELKLTWKDNGDFQHCQQFRRGPIWNFHHAAAIVKMPSWIPLCDIVGRAERAWPAEGSERHRRMIACCCCWAWHVLVPGTSGAPQPAGLLFDITPTGPNPALPYPSLLLPCYTLLGSQLTFYDLFYTHLQYMNILNNMEAASLDKDQSIVGTSGMSLLRTPATL